MILTELKDLTRSIEITELKDQAEEISNILKELKEELESHDNLVALSAPQIGKNVRVFALKFQDEIKFILNPLIVKRDKLIINRETNISCGEQEYLIPRFDKVEFIYMKPTGVPEQLEFSGLAAHLFQQMNDLLEGLQLSDYGLPIDSDFDDLTEDEKSTIIEQYMKSFDGLLTNLRKDIEEDPELRDQQHTIDFLTSVATGKTQIAQKTPNRATRRANQKMAKKLAKHFKENGVQL